MVESLRRTDQPKEVDMDITETAPDYPNRVESKRSLRQARRIREKQRRGRFRMIRAEGPRIEVSGSPYDRILLPPLLVYSVGQAAAPTRIMDIIPAPIQDVPEETI